MDSRLTPTHDTSPLRPSRLCGLLLRSGLTDCGAGILLAVALFCVLAIANAVATGQPIGWGWVVFLPLVFLVGAMGMTIGILIRAVSRARKPQSGLKAWQRWATVTVIALMLAGVGLVLCLWAVRTATAPGGHSSPYGDL